MSGQPQPSVIDVDDASFALEVIARSHELPVVVDFWAPWCGPCRSLGPILEDLVAKDFAGQMVLAKVNTDDNQALGAAYRIQGIPAVKMFRDGRVVDEFVGALPVAQVRAALSRLLPSEADLLTRVGLDQEAAEDHAAALASAQAAVTLQPLHPTGLALLGRERQRHGDIDGAIDAFRRIPRGAPEQAEADRRIASLELRREAGGLPPRSELERRLAADPTDVEASYGLALHLVADDDHRQALGLLLEVVARDRGFRDDGARKAMLRVFEIVGPRTPLADEFRTRLARTLY